MSCCGQQRAALRTQMQRTPAPPARSVPPVLRAPVPIAHHARTPTVARGETTGLTYVFGPDGGALDVDERDAGALLASGRFVTASR